MKTRTIISLFMIGLLVSCQKENSISFESSLEGNWNLINVSGGFIGANCDIPEGVVVWTFGDGQMELQNNDPSGDVPCSGVLTGTFNYSILEANGNRFLLIDGNESGSLTLEGNKLTIDQNELSTGTGADGFVLLLKKA